MLKATHFASGRPCRLAPMSLWWTYMIFWMLPYFLVWQDVPSPSSMILLQTRAILVGKMLKIQFWSLYAYFHCDTFICRPFQQPGLGKNTYIPSHIYILIYRYTDTHTHIRVHVQMHCTHTRFRNQEPAQIPARPTHFPEDFSLPFSISCLVRPFCRKENPGCPQREHICSVLQHVRSRFRIASSVAINQVTLILDSLLLRYSPQSAGLKNEEIVKLKIRKASERYRREKVRP